jgi:hypothetical protein
VAGSGDLRGLLALGHGWHAGQVGPDGEDERLAGDGDGLDLAGLGPLALQAVDGLLQLGDEASPKVFGLVWSKPLSRVIRAIVPAPPGRVTSWTRALVTTSGKIWRNRSQSVLCGGDGADGHGQFSLP